MQKGQTVIILLIGILILAAVGGAFYLGKQTTTQPSPVPVVTFQTTQPTAVPSTISDETTTWKTYSNQNYSFKYPRNWILAKPDNDVQNFYLSQASADIGGPGVVFSVLTSNRETMQVTFENPVGVRKETGDKIFVTKTQSFTLDRKPAFRYKQEVLPGSLTDAQPEMGVYVDLGNRALNIILVTRNDIDLSILDQILSTFKFAP